MRRLIFALLTALVASTATACYVGPAYPRYYYPHRYYPYRYYPYRY